MLGLSGIDNVLMTDEDQGRSARVSRVGMRAHMFKLRCATLGALRECTDFQTGVLQMHCRETETLASS